MAAPRNRWGPDMNLFQAVQACFRRYFDFQGRSSRAEYWWFVLFNLLLSIVTAGFDILVLGVSSDGFLPANTTASIITLVPGVAVSVRRLHDVGRSGWWIFIAFTVVGLIPLLYWACQPGQAEANEHGPPTA